MHHVSILLDIIANPTEFILKLKKIIDFIWSYLHLVIRSHGQLWVQDKHKMQAFAEHLYIFPKQV